MRLATLRDGNGRSSAVVDLGDGSWRQLPARDLSEYFLQFHDQPLVGLAGAVVDGEIVQPLPAPSKVVCCGLNYADHIQEMGRELPRYPTLFAKYADTLTGPASQLTLPAGTQVDWEGELAVVIGDTLRRGTREQAQAAIWGYTVANDVSVRDWQNRTLQWFQGKAWDATTPVGPVLVSADDVDPAAGVEVVTRVDGVERQRGNTKLLVFDAADLVAYVSTFTRLSPGDLVLTGTPGGVGMGMSPQQYLEDGAVLETEIAGIGTLRNRVVFTNH